MNHNKPDVYLIPESFYYRSRAENLSKPAKLLFPLTGLPFLAVEQLFLQVRRLTFALSRAKPAPRSATWRASPAWAATTAALEP